MTLASLLPFLAVAGGLPARMGEIQVWDVQSHKLTLALPLTADSLRAVSWSPDGRLVAVLDETRAQAKAHVVFAPSGPADE